MLNRSLLLAIAAAGMMLLGGCHVYFDDDDYGDGGYSYCDSSGCWWCDDYGCYPTDGDGGDGGWGTCTGNYDCAAGCYCSDEGVCEEAGFCSSDAECPEGFVCDDRASCVPEGSDDACTSDADCPWGSYCDEASGQCVGTGTCTADEECGPGMECDDRGTCVPAPCESDDECLEGCYCNTDTNQCEETGSCETDSDCADGFECDTDRSTCVPCEGGDCTPPDPGACYADVTCNVTPPTCPAGSLPGVVDGCYSGFCIPEASCPDEPPFSCDTLSDDEAACIEHVDCRPVYVGVDCTDPGGNACEAGDTGCTCEDFRFGFCEEKP